MNRWSLAALAGLLLAVSTASAQQAPPGYYGPPNPAGNNWVNAAQNGQRAGGAQPCPPGGGGGGPQQYGRPGVLGPWYLYYPYEAHFITPAHPQFPYWPSPQTLQGGRPDAVPPMYVIPSYWK